MASNYPSDPKNAASLSNPATPQSGPGGTLPEYPIPPMSSQQLAASYSAQSEPAAPPPSIDRGGGGHRRLSPGTELSGGRYRIDRPVAAGGMGAVYRAVDTRFGRPCAVKE